MIFQLETAGEGFEGKVKPIGKSEQMEREVFENKGFGFTVTVIKLLVSVHATLFNVLVTITR